MSLASSANASAARFSVTQRGAPRISPSKWRGFRAESYRPEPGQGTAAASRLGDAAEVVALVGVQRGKHAIRFDCHRGEKENAVSLAFTLPEPSPD